MKSRRSALLSSLLLGVIPAIAAVSTILPAEAAPETVVAAAAAPVLALEVPESPERSMLTEEGDETACGDYFWALAPDSGLSGKGSAAHIWDAMDLATFDAEDKLVAYSEIKCADCPIPFRCDPQVFTFDAGWSTVTFQSESGTWHATRTYSGLYQAYCTDCAE